MLDVFRKLMDLLDAREKRRFWTLMGLVLLMGFANMAGIAAIVPFLAVLADPSVVESNPWLAPAYDGLGFTDPRNFLILLGIGVFLAYVGSLAFKSLATWALIRFGTMRNFSIASRMMQGYLQRPYVWFLDRHSADLAKTVLTEVQQAVSGNLIPFLNVVANGAIALSLAILLIAVDPGIALVVVAVLGAGYAAVFAVVRRKLVRVGEERRLANQQRFRIAQEALGGIKEAKVLGLERTLVERFRHPALAFARAMATAATVNDVPRHLLEALAFGGMLAVVLVLMAVSDGDLSYILPVAGVYALAGSRLAPALQLVYRNIATIRFNKPTLDVLHTDFMEISGDPPPPPATPIPLRKRLELSEVRYAYPKAERTALQGLSIDIRANTTVGIVGGTGAGKTTAVDVMLGLLMPQEGELRVDGRALTTEEELRGWRRSLGYVPQQIYLVDDTVAANIAFGVAPEKVDHAAVERASRMAELHRFVTEELPGGYETMVGDRGVRLSGGQRQRIGLARALYADPDVLILDEATSALDNVTERAVMEAVTHLGGAKTIVMIAHRLTTVMNCDEIFLLERGRVAARGPYEELIERSDAFRKMAQGAA